MRNAQSSGWRALKPILPSAKEPDTADKQALYEAARAAARVLNLPSSCRFVLDQLVGVYGGELVENRMLVWPSNDFLVERTGIPERSVRFALARLLAEGVIGAKDSPNGKRFAQRSPRGQIIKAYGFDLSPLLAMLPELRQRLEAIAEMERERSIAYDELTIHRRSAQEALRALADTFPNIDIADLTERALELARVTPRRSSKGLADEARDAWKSIREEAETRYYTASAGNYCRHKDNNKYAPDQSCNNGNEKMQEAKPNVTINAGDLARACPDAMEFIGEVRNDRDLIIGTARMRGAFGVSASGWDEAIREIGALGAAATLIYVVQMQAQPAPGSEPIKNAGGYFRSLVRLIRAEQVDLATEVLKLLTRKRH